MLDEARTILPFERLSSCSWKKKRKRKRDEWRMRKILGSSSPRIRGEKRCNPFDRSNATQWQRITTFPDALRIFARVIVTCLRCYDCCLGMRTFFLFLFFLWIRKIEELLSRIYGETSRRSIIDSRIMETIFHWKCIHLQAKKEIQ